MRARILGSVLVYDGYLEVFSCMMNTWKCSHASADTWKCSRASVDTWKCSRV